ncbi:MAG TPA: hypothetical protein VFQ25_05655, partial [Ktedonobacterales bacterium]|nr:hypothetical protein [Ktedonobacterales bacterium]
GSSLSSYAGTGGFGQAGKPPAPPVGEPMGPSSPNAVTVWDPRFDAGGPSRAAPSAARAWPGPGGRKSGITISPLMMAAIGLGLVALLAMAATVGGLIGSNNSLGALLGPGATASATALPTMTPSPSPSPSPTPPANWLSVQPTTISLGCKGAKTSQNVYLTNQGPDKLEWQEHTQSNSILTGVTVSPDSGTIDPGHTQKIEVQNSKTWLPGNSGELDFEPLGDNTGDTMVVTYSAHCGG